MAGIEDLTTIQPVYPKPTLPEPKTVTTVEGVLLEENVKQEEKEKAKLFEVDPEDEMKFLSKEDDLLNAELDNADLRTGKRPPERINFWKIVYVALGAIAAIATLLKGCGIL